MVSARRVPQVVVSRDGEAYLKLWKLTGKTKVITVAKW